MTNLRNMRNISLNGTSGDPWNRRFAFIPRNDPTAGLKFEL